MCCGWEGLERLDFCTSGTASGLLFVSHTAAKIKVDWYCHAGSCGGFSSAAGLALKGLVQAPRAGRANSGAGAGKA